MSNQFGILGIPSGLVGNLLRLFCHKGKNPCIRTQSTSGFLSLIKILIIIRWYFKRNGILLCVRVCMRSTHACMSIGFGFV